MKEEKPKQETKAGQQPPQDRMIRKPASTRDVLGRDPKADVFAGGTGKLLHRHD